MSLLSKAMTTCSLLTITDIADGRGGQMKTYKPTETFEAAFVLSASAEEAEAAGKEARNRYRITVGKEMNLKYHQVIRRESDGKIFRIMSDGDDCCTPQSAGLNMRQVDAEEWKLPSLAR